MTKLSETHRIVSREESMSARKKHLADEKALTRERDKLSAARRSLPWVSLEKVYSFEGPNGHETLSDLFGCNSQLIVYHFMFGPDWKQGCPSCSFWIDNVDHVVTHLNHRDASLVAVGHAAYSKLADFRKRMKWECRFVSSLNTDFNFDYHASFEDSDEPKFYNFEERQFRLTETPGISVFYKDDDNRIYHTYSCYSRGLDMLNGAYHYMDLLPKGRDETENMSWVRLWDEYD